MGCDYGLYIQLYMLKLLIHIRIHAQKLSDSERRPVPYHRHLSAGSPLLDGLSPHLRLLEAA